MAVAAKDGSMHHSAGKASLHDSMSAGAAKSSHERVAPMKKPGGTKGQAEAGGKTPAQIPHDHPFMAGPHQTPTDTDISDHVQEHGPATHVHHMHDEGGGGMHHVTTHHGGMGENMHHSEHDSHEAAHEHMGKAMGAEYDENQTESPDKMNDGEEETPSAIPGIG